MTIGKIPTWPGEVGRAVEQVVNLATDPRAATPLGNFLAERWVEGDPERYDHGAFGPNFENPAGEPDGDVPEIGVYLRPYDPEWLRPLYKIAEADAGRPEVRFDETGVTIGGKHIPVPGEDCLLVFKAVYEAYPERISSKQIRAQHRHLSDRIDRLVKKLPTPLRKLIDGGKGSRGYRFVGISKP